MKNLEEIINRIIELNEELTPIGKKISKGAKSAFNKYSDRLREPAVSTYVKIKKPLIFPKKKKKELPFENITHLIINHIEGGYYPGKGAKDMKNSGETMFGMDRKYGSDFTNSEDGKLFWKLIDEDKRKNPKKWVRYYKLDDNIELKNKLLEIVTNQFLVPYYEKFSNNYLTNTALKEIVNYTPKLKVHMSYAVWNGSDWFRKFAKILTNKFEKEGIKDPKELVQVALNSRKNDPNTYIKKSGRELENEIFTQLT